MLLLKLQCFGHLLWRANWLEKTLILGKIEDKRRRGQQRMRELESITASVDMNLSKLQEIVKNKEAWRAAILQRVRYDLVIEQQTTKTTVKLFQTVYWKVYPSSIKFSRPNVKSQLTIHVRVYSWTIFLFHQSVCFSLCQYCTLLITVLLL